MSIPLDSLMTVLGDRILAHDDAFGTNEAHTAPGGFAWQGLSLRAIACEVIRQCTSLKPGGELPIDLPWLNERGNHQRMDYQDWDVQNQSCKQILSKLAQRDRRAGHAVPTLLGGFAACALPLRSWVGW